GLRMFPFLLMAREGRLWSDPFLARKKLGFSAALQAARADVCALTASAPTGPGLSRRRWLPFIPPLTRYDNCDRRCDEHVQETDDSALYRNGRPGIARELQSPAPGFPHSA